MEILVFDFIKKLDISEVTKIADARVKEDIKYNLSGMSLEEMAELFNMLSAEDDIDIDIDEIMNRDIEDDDNDIEDDDETYRVVLEEVNNFPSVASGKDFMKAIDHISKETGIDNPGIWWDVLENCLAKRLGRRNNCLA